jgi:flagellar biosynthesis protein FlhG
MLKTLHTVRRDAMIRLLVNMAGSDAQAQAVFDKLGGVSQQYLGRPLAPLGSVPRDPHVAQAVMRSQPFTIAYPQSPAARAIHAIAGRLVLHQPAQEPHRESFFRRIAANFGLAGNA